MKGIPMKTWEVCAILDNRKTVTRRVVKPQPFKVEQQENAPCWCGHFISETGKVLIDKPPYRPGDILYVRETFFEYNGKFYYKADGKYEAREKLGIRFKWHPSIHMPREAARIFLRVTGVRVERLKEITEDDVVAEGAEELISCPHEHGVINPDGTLGDMCWNAGCCGGNCEYMNKSYGELFGEIVWNSTIKPKDRALYGWEANLWVWVIEFERISKEEKTI